MKDTDKARIARLTRLLLIEHNHHSAHDFLTASQRRACAICEVIRRKGLGA